MASSRLLDHRYAIIAGLIAGVGLALVYVSLFRLFGQPCRGRGFFTGGVVLHAYVQYITFGSLGSGFSPC